MNPQTPDDPPLNNQDRPMVPRRQDGLPDVPPAGAARIPDGGPTRRVHITGHHVDVLRARRKRLVWGNHETNLTSRHRWLVEGVHGLAKTLHGMARAARRGLENMKIQALLTATAINLKRLAKAILLAMIQALLSAKNGQNIAA